MFETSKKKKILYLITKSNWGGAQKYVYDLATNLPEDAFDVAVALGGTGNAGSDTGSLDEKLKERWVRTIFVKNFLRDVSFVKELSAFFEVFNVVRTERPDIIHANSSKAGLVGALVGRLLGVPNIVITIHGWPFNEERPVVFRLALMYLMWLAVFFSHKTILVAEHDKKQVSWMPFVQNKLVVIHNGIQDIDFLSKDDARLALSLPQGTLIIGTIAELHKNKGLSFAIEAMKKIQEKFIYAIISEGDEREKLEKLIKENNLENIVYLLGKKENANQYLLAFDIFLLPSIKEGLPFALLEAGLAGIPVVATNVGGIPEIIEDGETGFLVEPENGGAIAEKLKLLIGDEDKRKKLGGNLRQKIQTEFNFENMLQKTLELYN